MPALVRSIDAFSCPSQKSVAARVDVGPHGVAEYSLLALVKLGPDEKKQIAEGMGAARYTIDTRRFSDGYWTETR